MLTLKGLQWLQICTRYAACTNSGVANLQGLTADHWTKIVQQGVRENKFAQLYNFIASVFNLFFLHINGDSGHSQPLYQIESTSEEKTVPIYRKAQRIASAMPKSSHSLETLPITADVQSVLAPMVATRQWIFRQNARFLSGSFLGGSFSWIV